jgi:hypothetical protein
VANNAHVRAIARLKNQRTLTKIADFDGEKGGGSDGGEGVDAFGEARSCWMFLRWNAEVSCGPCFRAWTDTETNVATAAENKPVYNVQFVHCTQQIGD